jgi:ABC-type protease/lipase transport system fused ATPase/permease subunit
LLAISQSGGNGLISIVTIGAFMAAAYKIIPGMVKLVNLNNQVKTYSFTADQLDINLSKGGMLLVRDQLTLLNSDLLGLVPGAGNSQRCESTTSQGRDAGNFGAFRYGQTTLINILLGFLESSAGEVLINGKATNAMDRQQFWKTISYVKQQPFLIHNSILITSLCKRRSQMKGC